jgi:hypothetical protein
VRFFGEDEIDVAHKKDTRDRILRGSPFTDAEDREHLDYCAADTLALARALPHIVSRIPSLEHAYARAECQWAMAKQEWRGVPLDGTKLRTLRENWTGLRADLVHELDAPFRCYEFDSDGAPHWRKALFADFLARNGMTWPTLESGALDETDQTFREMGARYPFIEPLRELRYSLSKLNLNALSVGSDDRNRTLLSAFGTKTARNAPSNSKFIFGPAKWLRFLITPPPGRVLIHRDYKQQEPRIAAILSGDKNLMRACEAEDLYLEMASQLGFLRESMNVEERKAVRVLFKVVVLGIQYGLGARSLAQRTGISIYDAREILVKMRLQFGRFEDYAEGILDHAGLNGFLLTEFGWFMRCPLGSNPRTLRNFPIQSTGSEILHVACILAERRGIEIVAPIHDAILVEGDLADAEDLADAVDRLMRDAAAVVLRGHELPTDRQIIKPGERYFDERGEAMWKTVNGLLAKRSRGVA